MSPLEELAEAVGPEDPVVAVGGRTQWAVGGLPDPSARQVGAPAGVVSHQPAEMVARVRAGTPVGELAAALAGGSQMAPLDPVSEGATVGGVLAVGRSGLRRPRWGPVRDLVLEVTYVSAQGKLVRAGGPVVKNVSGFDLCKLMVGSLGTLGVLAEVVLRTYPLPEATLWLRAEEDPWALRQRLFRPSSILWDGRWVWVLLEGSRADVEAEAASLGGGFSEAPPPTAPSAGRRSMRPSQLRSACASLEAGSFVAEVATGLLHQDTPAPPCPPEPSSLELNSRVKALFDPTGRMNPGRSVCAQP